MFHCILAVKLMELITLNLVLINTSLIMAYLIRKSYLFLVL